MEYAEMINAMIATGAKEETVWNFLKDIYHTGKISSRIYELLTGCVYDRLAERKEEKK